MEYVNFVSFYSISSPISSQFKIKGIKKFLKLSYKNYFEYYNIALFKIKHLSKLVQVFL